MTQSNIKIAIKNMVCNRCIKVVKEVLQKNDIAFVNVDLGEIVLNSDILNNNKEKLKKVIESEGFELVENIEAKMIIRTKSLIIENIHFKKEKLVHQNFSEFLSKYLNVNYFYLSKLFSEIEGKTIEHFIIEQKIERAKELLSYGELTLSQISYDLNYSSPQHLSRQFKQITGLTATGFKKDGTRRKLDTI